MTTHVFIVDETTFKIHLEYMFAGTGASDKDVDFNNSSSTALYAGRKYQGENNLIGMMADGCRIRRNDFIIFYVQAAQKKEGKFFGIFQAIDNGIFLDRLDGEQFLYNELRKSLTFRLKIRPYHVYAKGVTEWTALDEIKHIAYPHQMLWSLIYRKLRALRGNTMITTYEAKRLTRLIKIENEQRELDLLNKRLTYNPNTQCITTTEDVFEYTGRTECLNILPRLIAKYNRNLAHEAHLQMYITQNLGLGTNETLDRALGISNKNIVWLGNEVACGVGMQRIDIMFSIESNAEQILFPIELKSVYANPDNLRQLTRYLDWIEQYYIPNNECTIQPVLLCKGGAPLTPEMRDKIIQFNRRWGILPLKYIEYTISNNNIVFNLMEYQQ